MVDILSTVCPYTFISLILCSIMIEQGLSPQPLGGSWDSSPTAFGSHPRNSHPFGQSPHLVGGHP